MNNPLESRRLLISTLAPVHMGTDEDYEPTNYIIDADALYEFDTAGVARALPASEKQRLANILNARPDDRMLKGVQGFFHQNRDWLIPDAINAIRLHKGIGALYDERVGRTANREADGKSVINRLEIERCFYNPVTRKPVMPGSGLKGAIRTALLDEVNGGRSARKGERNRELQQRLFRYENDKGRMDLHRDPMRLVQLGDAPWLGSTDLHPAEVRFAVNRKRHPVEKNGKLLQSQAETKGLRQMLECVPAFRIRSFEGSVTLPDVSVVPPRTDKLPELRFGFIDIATACNRFYRPILEDELMVLHKRGYADRRWAEQLELLLRGEIAKRLDGNEAFLLRVGRHSGAASVTLNGLRSIKIMKGRGEQPEYLPESKTLWLAAAELNDQRGLMPFGWLLVEMLNNDETPPDWPQAEALMRQMAEESRDWQKRVSDHQRSLAEKMQRARQQVEEARRKEAEQARLDAEVKEKREQELKGLPKDAAWVVTTSAAHCWRKDNNAFLDDLETFLGQHDRISPECYSRLEVEITALWPGILEDPDATKGKKKKPKYRDRPKGIAKAVLKRKP